MDVFSVQGDAFSEYYLKRLLPRSPSLFPGSTLPAGIKRTAPPPNYSGTPSGNCAELVSLA